MIKLVAENPRGEQEFERVRDPASVAAMVQVTTSHFWTGVGVSRSLPAPVWSQVDETPETEFAFTAASVPSGSLQIRPVCEVVGSTRQGLFEPDPAGPKEREGEQTAITYASVFGL